VAIDAFKKGAGVNDPDLAAFANRTLRILEAHRRMAVALSR
jgi:hypothetical protein